MDYMLQPKLIKFSNLLDAITKESISLLMGSSWQFPAILTRNLHVLSAFLFPCKNAKYRLFCQFSRNGEVVIVLDFGTKDSELGAP